MSVVDELKASLNDPMWSDHAEISKATLRRAIAEIEHWRNRCRGERERCASVARQMNAPEVAGVIGGLPDVS